MTYRILGLDPAPYRSSYGLADDELARRGILRMKVSSHPGFPCRITLEDAPLGATMLLLNYVSHDVPNPYRASHAMFVTEGAERAAEFVDQVPPVLATRTLSLRGFDAEGMMADALLAQPGQTEEGIIRLFDNPIVRSIHAHNAVRGCFSAKIERN